MPLHLGHMTKISHAKKKVHSFHCVPIIFFLYYVIKIYQWLNFDKQNLELPLYMAQNFVRSSFSVHNVIVNQRIWLSFDVFLLYPGGIAPLLNSSTQYQIHIPGGEGGGHINNSNVREGCCCFYLIDRLDQEPLCSDKVPVMIYSCWWGKYHCIWNVYKLLGEVYLRKSTYSVI